LLEHRPKELITSTPDFRGAFLLWARETGDEKTARIKRICWNWLIYHDTGHCIRGSVSLPGVMYVHCRSSRMSSCASHASTPPNQPSTFRVREWVAISKQTSDLTAYGYTDRPYCVVPLLLTRSRQYASQFTTLRGTLNTALYVRVSTNQVLRIEA